MADIVTLTPYKVESITALTDAALSEIPDGVSMIQAPAMWAKGFKGQNTVVALIDTGVEISHPDLQGVVIDGYNFTSTDTKNYVDDNGHGTHCAGTIAAVANNTGVVGVAPETKILALKVLDKSGSGSFGNVIAAINYATNWVGPNGEKVNIISMSLGGAQDIPVMHDAVKNAVSNNIIIICAAGNDGNGDPNNITKSYPGYYDEVVSVGAFDGSGNIAYFSESNDEVDMVAPGYDVLSTYLNGQYARLSGTSMATPHVSGAAAVIISFWKSQHIGNMLEADLYAQMVKRADLLPNVDTRLQGNGMLILTKDVPRPSTDNIDIITAIHGLSLYVVDGVPTISSPDFWINKHNDFLLGKLTNADFVYLDLLIRKFYRTIL